MAKTIVLIAEKVSDRVYLVAEIYNKFGFKPILIAMRDHLIFSSKNKNLDEMFSSIEVPSDAHSAIKILNSIENKTTHYFTHGPDDLRIAVELLNNGIDYYLDYKDLFSFIHINPFWNNNLQAIELALLSNCRGITYRDQRFRVIANLAGINMDKKLQIPIIDYFSTNINYENFLYEKIFIEKKLKNKTKLILTGGVSLPLNDKMDHGVSVKKVLSELAKANLEITIIGGFSNTNDLHHTFDQEQFKYLNDLGVNVMNYIEGEHFDRYIADYDFALNIYNCDLFPMKMDARFSLPYYFGLGSSKRVFSYVKACLPVVSGEISSATNIEIFRESSFLVKFGQGDVEAISPTLDNLLSENLRKKIYHDRMKYSVNGIVNFPFVDLV